MPDKKQPETTKQPEATGGEDVVPRPRPAELVTEAAKAAVEISLPPRPSRPAPANRREPAAAAPAAVPVAPPVAAIAPPGAASEREATPPVEGAPVEGAPVEVASVATAAAAIAGPVSAPETPLAETPAPVAGLSIPSPPTSSLPTSSLPTSSLPMPRLASPSRPTASIPNRHTMETMMTTAEELISFQQGNLEALMKSGQIWAAGLQDMSRHWAAAAQATLDETMGTVKAMAQVKSLREAMELQSTLARTSVEKVVSEGGKLTDASLKLAEQTFAPISARLTLAAERFGRPAA